MESAWLTRAKLAVNFHLKEGQKTMANKVRVSEGTLCDYCKNPDSPLAESNSQHLFQRNWQGEEIPHADVHRGECADAWAKANGGTITNDEPLPRRENRTPV